MKKSEEIKEMETLERSLEEVEEVPLKVKKPRTQKQIDAFAKTNLIRQEKANLRKTSKESLDEVRKADVEKKIVAKAIALKKKQIKEDKMLSVEADVEPPVKPTVKKAPVKRTVKVKEPEPESESENSSDSDSDSDYEYGNKFNFV
jgi:hypothetical protein